MSKPGTQATQGIGYQARVALNWVIGMLEEDEVAGVQVESNGIPGLDEDVEVDDIVVLLASGERRHIQAKKNAPRHRYWSLSDLKDELLKAHQQLQAPSVAVEFVSSHSFGELEELLAQLRQTPDFASFNRLRSETNSKTVSRLSDWWNIEARTVTTLCRRIFVATPQSDEQLLTFTKVESYTRYNRVHEMQAR